MKWILGTLGLLYKLYIALVFVLTLLLFYPFIVVTLLSKKTKHWSFALHVAWSYLVRMLAFVWIHRVNKLNLPQAPYLIVSNHSSYFDIFFLPSILPQHRFLFLGKSELLSYPLIKTLFKYLHIPVYRKNGVKAGRSFIQSKQAIKDGWSLVIFPEGGIPDEGLPTMMPFKEGAFKLAIQCKIPLVPLTFLNHYHMFTDPGKIFGSAHPGISKVYVHQPITPADYAHMNEKELSEYVFQLLAKPLRERGLMESDAEHKHN